MGLFFAYKHGLISCKGGLEKAEGQEKTLWLERLNFKDD